MDVRGTYITPLSAANDGKCDGVSRSLNIDTHSLMNVVMEDADGTLANPRQLLRYFCFDGEVAPSTAEILQKVTLRRLYRASPSASSTSIRNGMN